MAAGHRRPDDGHAGDDPGHPGPVRRDGPAPGGRSSWSRVVVARRDDRRTVLVGLTVLAIAFFVVPTRVHERYLFPFFALGAILAATSFRWRLAYFVLAVANFANLYAVLTTPSTTTPGSATGWGSATRSARSPGSRSPPSPTSSSACGP